MDRLKDKVAIVTGSATGIGEAIARLFADEGAKVAVVDIDQESGEKVAADIVAKQGQAKFWKMDVREEEQVNDVFAKVAKEFGKIDILVNNAGVVGPDVRPHEVEMKDYDYVMDTDVRGTLICTKHVVPYMREQKGGSIVNLASICSLICVPESPLTPYHIAKGAVQNLTHTIAISYAPEHIRCNCVNPGTILTPLVAALGKDVCGSTEAYVEEMSKVHPMGCIGRPIDVAYGVLYLASDESAWTTGASISIDGGRVCS